MVTRLLCYRSTFFVLLLFNLLDVYDLVNTMKGTELQSAIGLLIDSKKYLTEYRSPKYIHE